MTLKAFQGDAAVKTQMIDAVRDRWMARKLVPATILKVDDENQVYSLGGALAGSQDIEAFVSKTGIPHELAMLCEALVSAGVEIAGLPTTPPSFSMEGADDTLAFGLQWLEAIRPGADLQQVTPLFMVQFLDLTLSDQFELAENIEPAPRAVANRILNAWKQELAGHPVDAKEWREIRKQAVAAGDQISDPWAYSYGAFLESLAWPVRGLASEFVSLFRGFAMNWMGKLQRPYLDPEDQEDQLLMMKGWHLIAKVSREHGDSEEATEQALAAAPEEKRALMTMGDPEIRARVRAGKIRAVVATAPALRRQMNVMLQLIESA